MSFVGRERELFDHMRERGIPVYHLSNLFVRDIQAAIRDFAREKENTDIGTREIDRLAEEFVSDLEHRGVIIPFRNNTYVLHMEEYRLKSAKDEETETAASPSEAVPA